MPGIEEEQRGATPTLDQNFKNVQSQQGWYIKANLAPNHSYLGGLFFSLQQCNINTSRTQHQMIVFVCILAGWSHFDDCPRVLRLCHMEQCMLNCCVCVVIVWVRMLVECICHSACTDAWYCCLLPYLESLPVCDGPQNNWPIFGNTGVR